MKKQLLFLICLASIHSAQADRRYSFEQYNFRPSAAILSGIKVGENIIITNVPYPVSPPAPFELKDATGKAYAKNTKAQYTGTTTRPGPGTLTYMVIAQPTSAAPSQTARQVAIAKIAPGIATIARTPQPGTSKLEPGRGPSMPGTTLPVRAQAAKTYQERIAQITELPPAVGTKITTTTAPKPLRAPEAEEIPRPAPMRMAIPTGGPHEGTRPLRTGFVAWPQPVGTQILLEPQYGAVTIDTRGQEALRAAAQRAKEAAQKLQQETSLAGLSQEEKQKLLINAVQKSDLALVKRILESGFKDNGKGLEEAELFALDPEDQNAQQIVNLLRESVGLSELESLEQELQTERTGKEG